MKYLFVFAAWAVIIAFGATRIVLFGLLFFVADISLSIILTMWHFRWQILPLARAKEFIIFYNPYETSHLAFPFVRENGWYVSKTIYHALIGRFKGWVSNNQSIAGIDKSFEAIRNGKPYEDGIARGYTLRIW